MNHKLCGSGDRCSIEIRSRKYQILILRWKESIYSAQAIFDICRRAEEMTDFAVDIVELEKIKPEYALLVRRKGKRIYERS